MYTGVCARHGDSKACHGSKQHIFSSTGVSDSAASRSSDAVSKSSRQPRVMHRGLGRRRNGVWPMEAKSWDEGAFREKAQRHNPAAAATRSRNFSTMSQPVQCSTCWRQTQHKQHTNCNEIAEFTHGQPTISQPTNHLAYNGYAHHPSIVYGYSKSVLHTAGEITPSLNHTLAYTPKCIYLNT